MKTKICNLFFMTVICLLLTDVCFSGASAISNEQQAEQVFKGFAGGVADTKEEIEDNRKKTMEEIVKIAPESAYGYFAQGYLLNKDDRDYNNKVIEYTNKAIKKAPGFPEAYVLRARVLADSNKTGDALVDLKKAIQIDSNNVYAYDTRAQIYENIIANKDLAIDDYSKLIELVPNAENYYRRSSLYRSLSDYEKAIQDYSDGFKISYIQKHDNYDRKTLFFVKAIGDSTKFLVNIAKYYRIVKERASAVKKFVVKMFGFKDSENTQS